jgi:radical SAM protein (TIGR01212 family)
VSRAISEYVQHYTSYSSFLKRRFGKPVAKIPVNGGFSCPNRDGTLSRSGCAFCDNNAFSPVAGAAADLSGQVHSAIHRMSRHFTSFIVYAQPFSNTYGTVERLRAVYEPLVRINGVVGVSIGTRPDCFTEEIYAYLAGLSKRTFLTVEIGLQSSHDATLRAINRGHGFGAFVSAVKRLADLGVETAAHVILGLPGESAAMMFETADRLASLPVQGVKFHQLMVVKGTAMEQMYAEGGVTPLSIGEYSPVVCGCIERLRPNQCVHRIMADMRAGNGLIAPSWSADKQESIRYLHEYMETHRVEQGKQYVSKPDRTGTGDNSGLLFLP